MKITDLINILCKIKNTYGDLDICLTEINTNFKFDPNRIPAHALYINNNASTCGPLKEENLLYAKNHPRIR